jgi:hypothetical protein
VSAAPVFGSWDLSRAGNASLAEGIFGLVAQAFIGQEFPDITYVGIPTLTEEALAPLRAVILTSAYGWSDLIDPPTPAEQKALFNYVLNGGSAVLLADGEIDIINKAANTALVAPFGATVTGTIYSGNGTVVDPLASPITNGPFGQVNQLKLFYGGWFSSIGPYATPLAYADDNGQPVLAIIEPGKLGPGSGAVILASDATTYITFDPGIVETLPLLLNTVAYLVPEPSSLGLALLGIAPLAWQWRRGRRR